MNRNDFNANYRIARMEWAQIKKGKPASAEWAPLIANPAFPALLNRDPLPTAVGIIFHSFRRKGRVTPAIRVLVEKRIQNLRNGI